MNILESLSLAVKNIVSSKTRTLLTMLGIIIGVAAVIVIVGLGNGLEGYVTDSFSDMGTNTLTVSVQSRGSTRTLEEDDMYAMVEENAAVASNMEPLTPEEEARIAASLEENRRLADLYCTGCNYCMPCPKGINIPEIFKMMNYHRV